MRNLTITALVLTLLVIPARAQDFEDVQGAGVARLSLVNGDVTVQRGDSGELVAGERNAPLVERDHVITGPNSRAEIQFDWANSIRLDSLGEVRIGELEPGDSFIQVVAGTAMFSVLEDSGNLFEISTPTVSVRPLREGLYRIEVRQDGTTDVIVRSGEAEIFTANDNRRLESGRAVSVFGDPASPRIASLGILAFDDWDRWNESRDRDLARNDSYRYVSRDIYGAEDLDRHGRWVYDAPYGWVWTPTVARGWAPYRVGRWSWVDYYGWTWISADPWGWAPYHYGRWYHTPRYGWVWYPGGSVERHYWRPALVAFFGWNSSRFSVSAGFGNVGWVPLAPREIYRPWYGRSGPRNVTINNVVVVNNVNIVETYRNARFIDGRTAVTSVSSTTFGRGRITSESQVQVSDRDLRRVAQVRGQLPVEPSSESRTYSDRTAQARSAPQAETAVTLAARRSGASARSAINAATPANTAARSQAPARSSVSDAAASRESAGTATSDRRTVTPRASTGTTSAPVRAGSGDPAPAGRPTAVRRATSESTPTVPQSRSASQGSAGPSTEIERAPARRVVGASGEGASGQPNVAGRRAIVGQEEADTGSGSGPAAPARRAAPAVESSPRSVERSATPDASTEQRSGIPARRAAPPTTASEVQRAPSRRAPSVDAGSSGANNAANRRVAPPPEDSSRRAPAPEVRNAPSAGSSRGRSDADVGSRAPVRVESPQQPARREAPAPRAEPQRAPAPRNVPAPEARPSAPSRGTVSPGSESGGAGSSQGSSETRSARTRR